MQHILDIELHLSTPTLILVATAIVCVFGAVIITRRRRVVAHRQPPPLVFWVRDRRAPNLRPAGFRGGAPVAPATPPSSTPPASTPRTPPSSTTPSPRSPGAQRSGGPSAGARPSPGNPGTADGVARPGRGDASSTTSASSSSSDAMRNTAPMSRLRTPETLADGRTVRMPRYIPDRYTVYVPGRLEVETGRARGEEIRFVSTRVDRADVTLGRGDGPPETHVKLPAETVSRRHARMQYEQGRWRITNLSHTNPTVVNGEELIADAPARWLDDGDTIEMGEIVLRFRTR